MAVWSDKGGVCKMQLATLQVTQTQEEASTLPALFNESLCILLLVMATWLGNVFSDST